MAFYNGLKNTIIIKNKNVKLDLSYGNILKCFDILDSPQYYAHQKYDSVCSILVLSRRIKKLNMEEKKELITKIFSIITPKSKTTNNTEIVFDFSLDEKYVYASFMDAYNIDLYEVAYSLPWVKFISLFHGLPEDTYIKKIIAIRQKKIPKPTSSNHEEIENLIDLKRFYSLDQGGNYQDQIDKLAKKFSS